MCSGEAFKEVGMHGGTQERRRAEGDRWREAYVGVVSRLRKLRSDIDRDRVIGGTGDVLCITPNEVIAWIDECADWEEADGLGV